MNSQVLKPATNLHRSNILEPDIDLRPILFGLPASQSQSTMLWFIAEQNEESIRLEDKNVFFHSDLSSHLNGLAISSPEVSRQLSWLRSGVSVFRIFRQERS